MARVMVKQGTAHEKPVRHLFCPECGEWDSVDNWTEYECYRIGRHNTWNIQDNHESDYICPREDTDEITVWAHESCDNYFQQDLEEREKGGPTWVCGVCGWESQNKARVMKCCL